MVQKKELPPKEQFPLALTLSNRPHGTIAEVFHCVAEGYIIGAVMPMRGREETRKFTELVKHKTLKNREDKIEWKWNCPKKIQ